MSVTSIISVHMELPSLLMCTFLLFSERHGPSGQTPIMYVQMQLPMPLLPDQPVLMSEANLQRLMQVVSTVSFV